MQAKGEAGQAPWRLADRKQKSKGQMSDNGSREIISIQGSSQANLSSVLARKGRFREQGQDSVSPEKLDGLGPAARK